MAKKSDKTDKIDKETKKTATAKKSSGKATSKKAAPAPEVKEKVTAAKQKAAAPAKAPKVVPPPAEMPEPAAPHFKPVEGVSRFSEFDIFLFKAGKHFKLYEKLGSHVMEHEGVVGTYFAVWGAQCQFYFDYRQLQRLEQAEPRPVSTLGRVGGLGRLDS